MGTTHEFGKRLEMMIILFLFITCMYTFEGIYLLGQEEIVLADTTGIVQNESKPVNPQNYTYYNIETQHSDPLGLVLGFFGFLTFQPLGMPVWATIFINIVMVICAITLGLLVYVFIRDWIPLIG